MTLAPARFQPVKASKTRAGNVRREHTVIRPEHDAGAYFSALLRLPRAGQARKSPAGEGGAWLRAGGGLAASFAGERISAAG